MLASALACGDPGGGSTGGGSTGGGSTDGSADASSSDPATTTPATSTTDPPTGSSGDPASSATSESPTSGGPDDTGSDGTTTEDVAPPLPTGWEKRSPPMTRCDPEYPLSVHVHMGWLFVGTNCGEVFRSPDAGLTWEDRSPTGVNGPQVWDFTTHGELLFTALRGAGVRRTPDAGDSWQDFSSGLSGFGPKGVLAIHRVGDALYIATFGGGVFTSGVDAPDWQPVNDETSDPDKQSPTSTCPDSPGYTDPVTMLPMTFLHGLALTDDGTHLYYSNKCGGVYRTPIADLPASAWEGYGDGLPFDFSYFQDPFSLATDGTYIYAGIDDEGAYRTLAGQPAAWTFVSGTGLINPTLDIIAWTVTGDGIYLGARFGGAYFSPNGDSPWTQVNMLPGGNLGGGADTIYSLAHDAQHVYVAADTGLFVSL